MSVCNEKVKQLRNLDFHLHWCESKHAVQMSQKHRGENKGPTLSQLSSQPLVLQCSGRPVNMPCKLQIAVRQKKHRESAAHIQQTFSSTKHMGSHWIPTLVLSNN